MCFNRNRNFEYMVKPESINDWDMCFNRNVECNAAIIYNSINDWDMCFNRNTGHGATATVGV